ncbi:polysaccharide deacetylase family protein [Rhodopirellula halodulae]|uniref:polysaccharide deacetylase family protein n=1 Tax=Rhodopirellula halodulae TaxID=2894198 RepID=UPI001E2DDAC6|nr:polysaccharide deacetylase family protein [Rhodopirellula sp. JC737]MCC9658712.1 polysaccharide deacetylase family protein [Rhodopirellula sp. JC737]
MQPSSSESDQRKASFTITTSWDDGHPLDFRLAELLNQYDLPATFYIPQSSQLETITEQQIRELSEQFEIGAHTLTHQALTSLPDVPAERQIRDSKLWIADVTGKECQMFCPPLGKFQREHVNAIARHGYKGYRTVELLRCDRPKFRVRGDYARGDAGWELACLPTSVQSHPHGRKAYFRNALKRGNWRGVHQASTDARLSDWPTLAEMMLEATERSGGVFHLWGHSWEIEANQQWENLERVFDQLSQFIRSGRATGATNGQLCCR